MPPTSPRALAEAFAAAMKAGDVSTAVELWIEDAAIVQPDGQVVSGREAIGGALGALVDHGVDVEVEIARVFATSEVALVTGTLTLRGADAEGRPFEQQSQSVVVYSKGSDGCWRVAIDAPWGLPPE
jgi:uncharacterized protein (TIGR02246 family)